MTEYKLPECLPIHKFMNAYTADQLREEVAKAEQRGREAAISDPDLTIAYMSGFADGKKAGREAMRDECVKVCEFWNATPGGRLAKALKERK